MTWFRNQSDVRWFDGPGDSEEIKEKVYQFLAKLVNF
jgi:tRNA A37 N6-isopentenylltransferase MiaA